MHIVKLNILSFIFINFVLCNHLDIGAKQVAYLCILLAIDKITIILL